MEVFARKFEKELIALRKELEAQVGSGSGSGSGVRGVVGTGMGGDEDAGMGGVTPVEMSRSSSVTGEGEGS